LNSLSKEKVLILNEIYKSPGVSVDDLARITGKSRKTIINHIIELKNLDIIVQKGKNSGLFLTKLGELLIKRSDKELTEDQVE
jgi:CRISPR locus-related DNA-binding protein